MLSICFTLQFIPAVRYCCLRKKACSCERLLSLSRALSKGKFLEKTVSCGQLSQQLGE